MPTPGGPAQFWILGPLEVRLGDQAVALRRIKERILLGLLVLGANRVVPLDELAGGLWDDFSLRPPATLRVHMSRLRRSLAAMGPAAPPLIASGRGYVLQIRPEAIDSRRFEQLAADGRRLLRSGEAFAAAGVLRQALGLWRGPVLEDLGLSAALAPEVVGLEEARLDALEDRIEADLICGANREVVSELEQLVGEHPLRERLWGQRMVALYRSGRQAEALRAYQDLRRLLAEQLGLFPSPDLQRLERAVLEQDPALEVGALFVPSPRLGVAASLADEAVTLAAPARLITEGGLGFCGRQAQVDGLLQQLKVAANGELKVVLVSGEAGIGKTRLAAEVARRVLSIVARACCTAAVTKIWPCRSSRL